MVVATVHIKEYNGGTDPNNPPTVTSGDETDDISNLNLVSTNAAQASSTTYPVTAGNRSFSKWVVYELHAKNDSNKIDNFKVWMTFPSQPTYATGVDYETNLNTTLTLTTSTYPAPPTANNFTGVGEGDVETASTMPLSEPGSENIGVSEGSGGLSTDGTHSDFIAIQLVTTGSTPPGNLEQKTFHFQYDEQ